MLSKTKYIGIIGSRSLPSSFGIVAFLHGKSRGTSFTVNQAVKKNIPVVVFLCGGGASFPIHFKHWAQIKNTSLHGQAFQGSFKVKNYTENSKRIDWVYSNN